MKTILLLFILSLTGCAQLDSYRRTYAVNYDADQKSGSVSMTLEPIAQPTTTPNIAQGLNDETIAKILKLLEESAKKNAPTD